jgi:non-homologous end joining protein Ku
VEALAAGFEPAKYRDTYRENLRALLDAKIRGEALKRKEPVFADLRSPNAEPPPDRGTRRR